LPFLKNCVEKVYLAGFEFTANATEKTPSLSTIDISNIDRIANELQEKFWRGIQGIKEQKKKAREDGRKVIGSAGESPFVLGNITNLFLSALAISLSTSSVNEGIVSATRDVSSRQPVGSTPKFQFNTVGDDRVCPICEPLDGDIMSESQGNIQQPPLHENCRCFLIPLV